MERSKPIRRRRGMGIVYITMILSVMFAFASLAVDVGRVQVAKTELRRTVDASARLGALTLPSGVSAVRTAAKEAATENTIDGGPLTLTNADIEFGTWDANAKTFTVLTGTARSGANAIRVTGHKTAARNTAIPLTFARIVGQRTCDIRATAIATYAPAVDIALTVPATSCPWLAGMPNGSSANVGNPHNNPDYAPAACPKPMTGWPLVAGQALNFDSINGGANNFSSSVNYSPDGNTGWIAQNIKGAENGIANLKCPINAVVGIFLNDNVPNSTMAPSTLDFTTSASRDFASITPQLKQPFFIGDGLRNDGVTRQDFIVPEGATRLFIGTMDEYEWNNNQGSYITTVIRPKQVMLVK